MGRTAALYLRLIESRIRAQLQYRFSFGLQIVGNGLISFLDFLGILIFFAHIPRLGGWELEEVAFLYSTSYIGMRLADASVGSVEQLPVYIRSGNFDTLLMRPLGSLFQMMTSDFSLRHLGGVIQGIGVFIYAVQRLDLEWSGDKIALTAVMAAAGFVIFAGVWILGNSISFWFIDTREVANAFTYGGNFVSQYPLHIFAGWLRRFFTLAIPIGFVNYYPSLYVLDKQDPSRFSALPFLSPVVAIAIVLVSREVWTLGVRHYSSTGS